MKRLDESLSHHSAHQWMPKWLEILIYKKIYQEPKIDINMQELNIEYLKNKLNTNISDKEKDKLKKQINLLEDCLKIYHLNHKK